MDIKAIIKRWAFQIVRVGVIGIVGWLARHHIGFVSQLLGDNVDSIVASICGVLVVVMHEADAVYSAHPEIVPEKLRWLAVLVLSSPIVKPDDAPVAQQPLPPVKDIKGGHIRIGLCLGVTALTVLTLLTGCSTVKGWFESPQAHDIERTVRVDVKDIAKIVVTDGKTITTTILADAQEFATNTTEQAAVAKTIVEIAPLLAK